MLFRYGQKKRFNLTFLGKFQGMAQFVYQHQVIGYNFYRKMANQKDYEEAHDALMQAYTTLQAFNAELSVYTELYDDHKQMTPHQKEQLYNQLFKCIQSLDNAIHDLANDHRKMNKK